MTLYGKLIVEDVIIAFDFEEKPTCNGINAFKAIEEKTIIRNTNLPLSQQENLL